MRISVLLLVVCLCCASAAVSASADMTRDPDLESRLRPLAERALGRELATGLQVAVVTKDGRLWSGAYGVADAETDRPVTPTTRFYVASTAKAILALTAARLDHRGELDLDATLADAFPPGIGFHPEYDPKSATVRDLLTHTHGIQQGPASFLIAFSGDYTNEKLFEMLPMHPPLPDRSFRYTNFGYDLMGLLLTPESKRGWTRLEEKEVFEPLGMIHTTNSPSELDATEIAMPHQMRVGGIQRVRLAKADANVGPAGGQFTTAEDLAKLLLMELNLGRVGGEQVFAEEVIRATQRQHASQDREIFYYHRHGWGLGWDLGTYDGDTVVQRSGGFGGYYSNAAFMPDHGFGIVVLSNGGFAGMHAAEILAGAIYDTMRGREDATERMDERFVELEQRVTERQREFDARMSEIVLLEAPLRPLGEYVGTYQNPIMGSAEIVLVDDHLEFRLGMVQGELSPVPAMENGAIEPFFTQLLDADDEVRFEVGDDGSVQSLSVRGTPLQFARVR